MAFQALRRRGDEVNRRGGRVCGLASGRGAVGGMAGPAAALGDVPGAFARRRPRPSCSATAPACAGRASRGRRSLQAAPNSAVIGAALPLVGRARRFAARVQAGSRLHRPPGRAALRRGAGPGLGGQDGRSAVGGRPLRRDHLPDPRRLRRPAAVPLAAPRCTRSHQRVGATCRASRHGVTVTGAPRGSRAGHRAGGVLWRTVRLRLDPDRRADPRAEVDALGQAPP